MIINVYLLQEPHTNVAKPIKDFRHVLTDYYDESSPSSSSEDYSSDLSEDDYEEDSEDLEYAEEGEGKSMSCGAQYIILFVFTHSYALFLFLTLSKRENGRRWDVSASLPVNAGCIRIG